MNGTHPYKSNKIRFCTICNSYDCIPTQQHNTITMTITPKNDVEDKNDLIFDDKNKSKIDEGRGEGRGGEEVFNAT